MKPDGRDLQFAALRHRLSMLSEASLRITESLDLDTVLQESWTAPVPSRMIVTPSFVDRKGH